MGTAFFVSMGGASLSQGQTTTPIRIDASQTDNQPEAALCDEGAAISRARVSPAAISRSMESPGFQ